MRKRVQIVLAVLLLAIAGVIAWRVLRPQEREPVYQGKGLRAWLWEYSWDFQNSKANHAVRQIGTNAIPTLLNMLRERDSALSDKLIGLWIRHIGRKRYLPAWVRKPFWLQYQPAVLKDEAVLGFGILGADAQQAVPELVKIYEQNISPGSRDAASWALVRIGPAARIAIPSFLRDAGSSNKTVCVRAVWALSRIHTEASLVVPALMKCLSDTNEDCRVSAAEGLGAWGTNAQQAVPALVLSLGDPSSGVRDAATNALKQIDPAAAAKAGVK